MIKLDAIINDKKLLASIQKGVDTFNRSASGKAKLNLKVNEKGFRQPLGRITGDLDKFESALAASNARVIAFGASTAVIGGITKAFKALAQTTTMVQKQFADINRILNVSNRQFEQFSNDLFDIGKRTATSFDDASKAALEFARQGLGLNETLKRTADALTLVRLTGVNADKAVSALTATVNAFKNQSITTSDALNKFIAVETKFAVSARDLMDALGRVGSAAVDAKVDFNELNAMVAAVQQQTGRGGAVIGNALKTIFTRLQRKDTLTALEDYGIAVRDIEGSTLPAMSILKQFASTYKTLTDSNKAYLREQVAGVFQANILSAVVKDLNSNTQVYGRALTASVGATNEANMANIKLNRTLSAMISQTGTELTRFGENVGKITFEPLAKAMLGPLKGVIEGINNLLDGEGTGSEFAQGFLKGIRNIIAGPGMIAAIAIIGTTFIKTLTYITRALPTIVGITTETQKRAKLEASISALLQTDAGLTKQIAMAEGNTAKQAGILVGHAQKTATAFKAQETSVANMARMLAAIGMTTNKMGAITPAHTGRGAFGRGAGGYIPGVSGEMHDIRKGVGGVSPSARPVHIPNFAFGRGERGSIVANTGEHIVPNFRGGGSAIFNPEMVRANGGLPQGAKRITAAQGHVPNFAPPVLSALEMRKRIMAGNNPPGWNNKKGLTEETKRKARQNMEKGPAPKGAKPARGIGIDETGLNLSASDIGLGAIVGTRKSENPFRTVSAPFSMIKKIAGVDKSTYANELQDIWGPDWRAATVELKNIPVSAIPGQLSEADFRKKINTHLTPGLHAFAVDTFGSVFSGDKAASQFVEGLAKKQFVFSKQAEGGIFETALKLATGSSKSFGIDEQAAIDFNESSNMNAWLKDRFFKGSKITRADAKRTDDWKNIRSLVPKAMADPLMGGSILNQYIRPAATAAGGLRKKNVGKAPIVAAQGYVPNFFRADLMHRLRGVQGARGLINSAASMRKAIESASKSGVFQDKEATKAFVKKFKKDFPQSGAYEAGIRDPGATAYNAAITSITGLNRQRSVGARTDEVGAAIRRLRLITGPGIGKARKGIAKEYLTLRKEAGLTKGIAMQKFDSADFSSLADYGSGSNRYTLSVQGGVLRANNVRQHEYRDARVGNISIEDHKRKQFVVMEDMSPAGAVNFPPEFKAPLMEAASKYRYPTILRSKLTEQQAKLSDVQRFRGGFSEGYVPNFSGLGAAIQREKKSGVPSSAIRINSAPRFQSPQNPAGLAVTNKLDEPGGLRDVPNFADPIGFGSGRRGSVGGPAVMTYNPAVIAAETMKTSTMLASEQRKLITATRAQITTAIGSGLTAKELMVAEKQLIAETKKSVGYKRMSGASQKQYIVALRQEVAQLNASVPGKGAGGMGGMMGGRGMMAGMGVMMAAPMLGGAIEQSVGGRGGAAASGALTGLGTGAGMGMMFGPWGAAIGAVVGGLGGLAVSLYATRETFESLVEDAEELGNVIKGNKEAVDAYKQAVTAQNEATAGTREHIEATKDARQALIAIGDPSLRSAIARTRDNFKELNKEMEAYTTFQEEKQEAIELKVLMLDALKGLEESSTITKPVTRSVGGGPLRNRVPVTVMEKFKVMTPADLANNAFSIFGDIMKMAIEAGVKPENLQRALKLGTPEIKAPAAMTEGELQKMLRNIKAEEPQSTVTIDELRRRERAGVAAPAREATEDEIRVFLTGLKLTGALTDQLASFLKDNQKARKVWMDGGEALYKSEVEAAAVLEAATKKKKKIEFDLLSTRLAEMRAYKKRIIEMQKLTAAEKRRTKMNNALVSFQTSLFKKTGLSETRLAAMTTGGLAASSEQRRASFVPEFILAQQKGIKTLIDGFEVVATKDRKFLQDNIFRQLMRGDKEGLDTAVQALRDISGRGDAGRKAAGLDPLGIPIITEKQLNVEKLIEYADKLEKDFLLEKENLKLQLRVLDLKDKQNVINAARVERESDVARQLAVMTAVSKTGLDARSEKLRLGQAKQSLFFQDPMNLVGMSNVQIAQQKRSDTLGNLEAQQQLERDKQVNKQGQEIVKALAGAEINKLTRDLIEKEVQLIQALKDNTAALKGEAPGATPATTTVFSGEQFVVPTKKPAASKVEPNPYAGIGRRNAFNLVSDPADFGPSGARSPQYTVSPDIAARGTKYLEEIGLSPLGIQGAVGNIFEPTSLQAPTVDQKIEKVPKIPAITGPRLGQSQMKKKSARLGTYKQQVAEWQKDYGLTVGGAVGAVPEGMAPGTTRVHREKAAVALQEMLVKIGKLEKELKSGADEVVLAQGKGVAGKGAVSPLAAIIRKTEEEVTLPQIDISDFEEKTGALIKELYLEPEKNKKTIQALEQMIILHGKANSQLDTRLKTTKEITKATEDQAVALKKQRTGPGAFKRGVDIGTDQIAKETDEIFYVLGEQLPMQFRNNMVDAIGAAMDKTSSLGDALDGVALAFLSTMRNAFLQSAVGNMMNIGKTLWTGSQRGGFIAAQNGTFVGGNSTGDKHPALLESGEYVLNRNAVGALGGPDALNSINFGMAPRFQKGGGHLMKLSEDIPSSRFSGLFLQQGNPEYAEYADAASARMQKAQEKYQKKQQKKAMILSTLISGVMAAGMGALGKGFSKWNTTSKWGSNRVGDPAGWSTMNKMFGQKPEFPGSQRGGFIGRQAGGSIGGAVARRYGLFQGGGTVPVSSGAPSLGGSTNTNNISINISLGGDSTSPGSGASQTATGNTGGPSKATTADAKALSAKIKSQVLKIITEEQRVGGSLSHGGRRP